MVSKSSVWNSVKRRNTLKIAFLDEFQTELFQDMRRYLWWKNLYSLKSLKTIKNYPKYLLAPHDFMYSADIIMPAMERLDEKCLHKVSFITLQNGNIEISLKTFIWYWQIVQWQYHIVNIVCRLETFHFFPIDFK